MKGKKIIACVVSLAMMVCSFGMLSVAGAAESEDIPSTTTGHVSYFVSSWAIDILPFYDNADLRYAAMANFWGYISVDGSDRTRMTGDNKLVADVGDIHAYYSVETDGNDVWVTFNAVNKGTTSHSVKLGTVLDSVLCDVDYSNGVLTFDRHGQSGRTNPYLYTYRISSDDSFDTCYLGKFYTTNTHDEENSIIAHVFENSNITSLKITDFLDTGACFSWNETIAPGATVSKTVKALVQRPQTVEADDVTLTYGDDDAAVEATTTGDGTLSYEVTEGTDVISIDSTSGAITALKSGTAKVTVTASETQANTEGTKEVNVTVNKKEVTATASDASKDWGSDDPVFECTADDADCTLTGTPEREEGEDIGEYAIGRGTVEVSSEDSDKYTIKEFVNGTFTINDVDVDVTVDFANGEEPKNYVFGASQSLKVFLERHMDTDIFEGKAIEGWYTDPDFTSEYDSSQPVGLDGAVIYAKRTAVEYKFVEGMDSEWTKESGKTLEFTAERNVGNEFAFNHFTGIEVDGEAVDEKNYEAVSGSVVVTLKADYLNTLKEGAHTITLKFDDADAITTNFTVKGYATPSDATPVKTGDGMNLALYLMIAVLFAGGAAVSYSRSKKEVNK
ncbi:MAG: hypothetical protein K5848_08620 [Lachnospiraceae bacterium]|nr:hypothetical protein [Lachnospiraceae bacterium]